eukprot:1870835-Alexandrium_andersonii.AAC.1
MRIARTGPKLDTSPQCVLAVSHPDHLNSVVVNASVSAAAPPHCSPDACDGLEELQRGRRGILFGGSSEWCSIPPVQASPRSLCG